MVVKRQKSDANLSDGKEVALVNGKLGNGALIQAVRPPIYSRLLSPYIERPTCAEPTTRRLADGKNGA